MYDIGVSSHEKAKLAAYQLKDVAQTWYTQWRDNRALRAGPISWEILRREFMDMLFLRDKRESKVEDLIKLCQGGISVLEYSLVFTRLSKYAPSFVSNPRYKMSHFVTGVSDDLVEEFHLAMLHENMNISFLMVHAQQV